MNGRRVLAIGATIAAGTVCAGMTGAAPAGADADVTVAPDLIAVSEGGASGRGEGGGKSAAQEAADRQVRGWRAVSPGGAKPTGFHPAHRPRDCPIHWLDLPPLPNDAGGDSGGTVFAPVADTPQPGFAIAPMLAVSPARTLPGADPAAPAPASAPLEPPAGGPMPPGPPVPAPTPRPTPTTPVTPRAAAAPPPERVGLQQDPVRLGYPHYLNTASVPQIAALALPGVAGLAALTGMGGFVGYRQAKAGFALRAAGTARFL